MKCVRIGYGKIATIHEAKLGSLGVRTVGTVDINRERRVEAQRAGFHVCDSIADAAALKPHFWDVCVSTDHHTAVVSAILDVDPGACVLLEKPACTSSDIKFMTDLACHTHGTIVVNENYAWSAVTALVRETALRLFEGEPTHVFVEMSKDRRVDFEAGRFCDQELLALGYEGSHMLAILRQLGSAFTPHRLVSTQMSDLTLSDRTLHGQGHATVRSRGIGGMDVEIHTALDGRVGRPQPSYPFDGGTLLHPHCRYRVVALEGRDRQGDRVKVTGFYEPLPNVPRNVGRLVVLREGHASIEQNVVADDTMGRHLGAALRHFRGEGENPYSLGTALEDVRMLHDMVHFRDDPDLDCQHALVQVAPPPRADRRL